MCDGTIINLLNIVTLYVLLNADVALFYYMQNAVLHKRALDIYCCVAIS